MGDDAPMGDETMLQVPCREQVDPGGAHVGEEIQKVTQETQNLTKKDTRTRTLQFALLPRPSIVAQALAISLTRP